MTETLELPNGEEVTPEDVFLYNNYPYRFVPETDEGDAFKLSPLYWGDSEMDVPFPDEDALTEQWGDGSRGTLSTEEWEQWLRDARRDERFGEAELDAIEDELSTTERGIVTALRDALGL
ncbi:hypothetical protein [Halostella sp. PRR32]|uniref:hypothetical protein n=1 Tax=Halostella sp. PRR32 TaxID=3098147 RepID=UPI002B1E69F1|nr:hypothetical protein [Halostella sp. PRR32]